MPYSMGHDGSITEGVLSRIRHSYNRLVLAGLDMNQQIVVVLPEDWNFTKVSELFGMPAVYAKIAHPIVGVVAEPLNGEIANG